jgi:heme oxygenase
MQPPSRTLVQLNLATREHHAAADAVWLQLLLPTVTKNHYIEHLIKVYGFEAPLEAALRYTPGLSSLVDLRPRVRAGVVVQDLMRLGLGAARIATLGQHFMTFASPTEALGWMFVAERATLLHSAVRHYLTLHIPDLGSATSYLEAHGVSGSWSDLGNALETVADSAAARRQLIRAASQAFFAYREWFDGDAALFSVGNKTS